jgi:integrase/recombinase XerD
MLEKHLKAYQKHLKDQTNFAQNSILSYTRDLEKYITFLEKNYDLDNPNQITKQHIQNFIARLKRKENTSASIGRKMSSIRSFHHYLLDKGLITYNHTLDISLPKRRSKRPDTLSIDQIDDLLNATDGDTPLQLRNKAIIELLYGCGLRVNELLNLKLTNLRLKMGFINIHGKGKKERIIPIAFESAYALKQYIDRGRDKLKKGSTDLIFFNSRGTQLSRIGVYKMLDTLRQKANIDQKISPQTLRHSFASHMLENGVDIKTIQELLGHEDISSTYLYKK